MTRTAPEETPTMPMTGQRKIWHYYQTVAPKTFQAARPRLDSLLRQIARRAAAATPRVLNIGVGDGYFETAARQRGWTVHALDPDRASLASLIPAGIHVHAGTIDALPLADATFDFVVASEVLEHLTDGERQAGLAEIARILRGGGYFLGTVPYRENLDEGRVVCPHCGHTFHRWGHQRAFDEMSIRRELGPHFAVERVWRTAFVAYRGRGPLGKMKSLVRWALARCGQPIAVPTIAWRARKPLGAARR